MISLTLEDLNFNTKLINTIKKLKLESNFIETKKALLKSTQLVETVWKKKAVENSVSQLKTYIQGIRTVKIDDFSYSIQSTSKINAEKDIPPYDMKPSLLGGPKARQGKNSVYNIIPFIHKVKTQENEGIYQESSKLEQSIVTGVNTSGRRLYKWRGRLMKYPHFKKTKTTPVGDYTWKAHKHQGMVRMKGDAKLNQKYSTYLTFRVVSSNSDPASWWHPGKKNVPIRDLVITELKDQVTETIRQAVFFDINTILDTINN